MKTKKIRGHKRRWKDIDQWISNYKNLDVDDLKAYSRDYAKIRTHPWSGLAVTNSIIPQPSGETKRRIIQGLIDIYNEWEKRLDQLKEPYYLKIWLFEPRFTQSQVVCAIGDEINYYENLFHKPTDEKQLRPGRYGQLEAQLKDFNWDCRWDEDQFYDTEIGAPDDYESIKNYEEHKRWVENLLKKPHRTEKLSGPDRDATEAYYFKKGNIWLGQK